MTKTEKLSLEKIKEIEDEMREVAERLDPFKKATLYSFLYHGGMSLRKAQQIRYAAGALN